MPLAVRASPFLLLLLLQLPPIPGLAERATPVRSSATPPVATVVDEKEKEEEECEAPASTLLSVRVVVVVAGGSRPYLGHRGHERQAACRRSSCRPISYTSRRHCRRRQAIVGEAGAGSSQQLGVSRVGISKLRRRRRRPGRGGFRQKPRRWRRQVEGRRAPRAGTLAPPASPPPRRPGPCARPGASASRCARRPCVAASEVG